MEEVCRNTYQVFGKVKNIEEPTPFWDSTPYLNRLLIIVDRIR